MCVCKECVYHFDHIIHIARCVILIAELCYSRNLIMIFLSLFVCVSELPEESVDSELGIKDSGWRSFCQLPGGLQPFL